MTAEILIYPTATLDRLIFEAAKALYKKGELSKESFEKIKKGIEAKKSDSFDLKNYEIKSFGS